MKSTIGIILLLLCTNEVFSKEKSNLLSDFHTRKFVNEALIRDNSWINYPAYTDRESWAKIPDGIRRKTIEEGEKHLGYNWPSTTATMYLEFTRTGNRAIVDGAISKRLTTIRSLVMAELMEGKGRFMDDVINGVFSICEQTYWGMSATFYMYKTGFQGHDQPNTVLPDIDDPIVDLSVGDTAADLAWIWYFLHDEFDKISPVISKRLKHELQNKVLDPFYSRYDFWWITGWGEGRVNNWNPWCNHNLLTCIMLIEDDPVKKEVGIYKTMESVDLFINSYPADGACDEGPNYWSVAGGKLFDYLNLLKQISSGKLDIFSTEIVKNIGRYIYRVYINNGPNGQYYANYSDSPAIIRQDPGRIIRYGEAIKDSTMETFGAFLLKESDFKNEAIAGRMGEALENLFNLEISEKNQVAEPLIPEFYFKDRDIAIARDKKNKDGFCFVAKGGSNGEGHNHNDVGSFMLYHDGNPVFIDVGVGTYTRETFSAQRYNIWTMQSNYHNVPFINGFAQSHGGGFKAKNSKYTSNKNNVIYSTDISGAYPPEAKAGKWIRTYTLEHGKRFVINDLYQLNENIDGLSLHYMTSMKSQVLKPGILELKVNESVLYMKYDPLALSAQVESIIIDDIKIQRVWGNDISRIIFKSKNNNLSGNLSIIVTEKNE